VRGEKHTLTLLEDYVRESVKKLSSDYYRTTTAFLEVQSRKWWR
jgi:hypothetical protein